MALKTIIFKDPNSEPPKNWLWNKNGEILKWNKSTKKWEPYMDGSGSGSGSGSSSGKKGKVVETVYNESEGFNVAETLLQLRKDYDDGSIFDNTYVFTRKQEEWEWDDEQGEDVAVIYEYTVKAKVVLADEQYGCILHNFISGGDEIEHVKVKIFDCSKEEMQRAIDYKNAFYTHVPNATSGIEFMLDEGDGVNLMDLNINFGPFDIEDAYDFGNYTEYVYNEQTEEDEDVFHFTDNEYPILLSSNGNVSFTTFHDQVECSEDTDDPDSSGNCYMDNDWDGFYFVLTDKNGYLYKAKVNIETVYEDPDDIENSAYNEYYVVSDVRVSNEKFEDWYHPVYDEDSGNWDFYYSITNPEWDSVNDPDGDEHSPTLSERYSSVRNYKYIPLVATDFELNKVRSIRETGE